MFRRPSAVSDTPSLRSSSACIAFDDGLGDVSPSDGGAEITSPDRELAPDELSELRSLIRGTLKLDNCSCAIQAEEDANYLVNFAVNLISDGLAVISVLGELHLMEVEICPPASLDEMRVVLASFLGRLHEKDGREGLFKKSRLHIVSKAFHHKKSLQSKLLEGGSCLVRFGLPSQTAAAKAQEEHESPKKKVRGCFQHPDGGGDLKDMPEGEDVVQPAFLSVRRLKDLTAIMNDMTLTEKERTASMQEVMAKYRLMQMKIPEASPANWQIARCA